MPEAGAEAEHRTQEEAAMSIKPTKKSKSEDKADTVKAAAPHAGELPPLHPTSVEAHRSGKSDASDKTTAIEEAIEIALEAASTAVDSALEIQRIRNESFKLISETRKNSRLLLYTSALIFVLAGIAVFGSLVYFKRAMNDLDLITKVNRDALLVFSGEINGLVAIGKKIDENVKSSSLALDAITTAHGDLTKRIQGLSVALTAANASIAKLEAQERQFSDFKRSLDELSSATRSANAKAADLLSAATRTTPAAPAAKVRPGIRAPVAARSPGIRPAVAAPNNSMIRYP